MRPRITAFLILLLALLPTMTWGQGQGQRLPRYQRDLLNSLRQLRNRGMVPISCRGMWPNNLGTGVSSGLTTKVRFPIAVGYDATGPAAILVGGYSQNISTGDNEMPNNLTVHLGFENGQGLGLSRMTAQGRFDIGLEVGSTLLTDSLGVDITGGSDTYVRTWVSATGSQQFPFGWRTLDPILFEGRVNSLDYSVSNTISPSSVGGYAPLCLLGYVDKANPVCVGLVGDSILRGLYDTQAENRGLGDIALGNSVPWINFAVSGERIQSLETLSGKGRQFRLELQARLLTHVILEYGTNDVYAGRTTATNGSGEVEADLLRYTRALKRANPQLKVFLCTLLPRPSASSDGFRTAGGQTPNATYEASRVRHNTYVRAFAGKSPFDGLIDLAARVEVDASNVLTLNGGRWQAPVGDLTGTLTIAGATSTTVQVTPSPGWTTDQFKNKVIYVLSGPGAGQSRAVLSNTADTLTLWTDPTITGWTVNPTSGTLVLSDPRTIEGIHPTTTGHTLLATAIVLSRFAAISRDSRQQVARNPGDKTGRVVVCRPLPRKKVPHG